MDMHTATEQAYKNGYAAAAAEKDATIRMLHEEILRMQDEIRDLERTKRDSDALRETIPYRENCPLCGCDLELVRKKVKIIRSGDFYRADPATDRTKLSRRRTLLRLWKKLKEHVEIEETPVGDNLMMLTAKIEIAEKKQ